MSEYYLVDVKSITTKAPRSSFKVDEIDALAQSILSSGGLLSPLLLKQTGIESYEVLAGDLEYYAAARAKELNPRAAEMVNAFVVPNDLAETAVKQLEALKKISTTQSPATKPAEAKQTKGNSFEGQRLTNLEARMEEIFGDIKQTRQQDMHSLEQKITALQHQLPTKIEPLEVFNTASTAELLQKMNMAAIKGKTAEKLINGIEKARSKEPFTSFKDVIKRVDGLGDGRMLTMLDAWGGMY
ncbi:MAG: ParB-like nuclease domain [Phormidesmis priestleyi Ana]|uniref:ParB-like nuclease domain n=1 Tax=Phormidesmis priestleyi Ana TaxID=1666911 RepID=A0A0P7ZIW8_9CYAN|nr:MAG: ParB-like nuclease domain [Phormidesmis priestleyi Ana]